MPPAILTRDANLAICEIYAEYLNRRKNGTAKRNAAEFNIKEVIESQMFPTWPEDDLRETLNELKRKGFLKMYITGDFGLSDDAVIYMENRFKNGLKEVLDVISKLKP